MKIETVSIGSLSMDPENARKHSPKNIEAIAGSLKTFGQRKPIVVWDGIVIAGNGTVEAAMSLGWEKIDVVRCPPDWSAEQARAFALADNRTAELAEWDAEILANQLVELDSVGYEIGDWGFEPLTPPTDPDDIESEDIPDLPDDPITKLGDVWIMGEHKLICGDATKSSSYSSIMGSDVAAITFTSPPYNAGKSQSLSGSIHLPDNKYGEGYNDDRSPVEWLQICNTATKQTLLYSKHTIWNVQPLAGNKVALMEYLYEWRNNLTDIAIWNKTHAPPQMASNVMNSQFEFLIILAKENNPSRAINTGSFHGNVSNVVEIAPQRNNEYSSIHAATFPVALPEWIITNFTQPNDIVIDPFAGTGTTMIAANKLNRRCAMIEIDPRYCDLIVGRWEQLTELKAHLKEG